MRVLQLGAYDTGSVISAQWHSSHLAGDSFSNVRRLSNPFICTRGVILARIWDEELKFNRPPPTFFSRVSTCCSKSVNPGAWKTLTTMAEAVSWGTLGALMWVAFAMEKKYREEHQCTETDAAIGWTWENSDRGSSASIGTVVWTWSGWVMSTFPESECLFLELKQVTPFVS